MDSDESQEGLEVEMTGDGSETGGYKNPSGLGMVM